MTQHVFRNDQKDYRFKSMNHNNQLVSTEKLIINVLIDKIGLSNSLSIQSSKKIKKIKGVERDF